MKFRQHGIELYFGQFTQVTLFFSPLFSVFTCVPAGHCSGITYLLSFLKFRNLLLL